MEVIYVLIDPVTNEICYLGKTDNPERRLKQHCSKSLAVKSDINKWIWIRGLLNIGMKPTMLILNCDNTEFEAIHKFWDNGHPLLNNSGVLSKANNSIQELKERQARLRNSEWYVNHRETRGISILKLIF